MGDNKWSHLRKQKAKQRKQLTQEHYREQEQVEYYDRRKGK